MKTWHLLRAPSLDIKLLFLLPYCLKSAKAQFLSLSSAFPSISQHPSNCAHIGNYT